MKKFNKKTTFGRGGVHPPEMKLTSGQEIIDIELPRRVVIGLSQSIGRPAAEKVTAGDHVERGQLIGEAQGPVSANVHTPISGSVKNIGDVRDIQGHWQRAVTIEASDEDHFADLQAIADAHPVISEKAALELKPSEIIDAIRNAGIVGLGGATFPTPVKLSVPEGVTPTLVINGSECEPYLTCDEQLMRELPHEIVTGIALLMRATGAKNALVGIEDNKPEAIKRMTEAAKISDGIDVIALKTKYPQGGEKMLVEALTGRKIAPGALPISQGTIVQNVATALAVYHAVVWQIPLIERVLTISGESMAGRGNYRVPIGTDVKWLLDKIGGIPEDAIEMVAGGTMMGRSLADVEGFTTKGTGGLLLLNKKEVKLREPEACVRCGRCVDSCPMGLQPYLLARLSEHGRAADAMKEGLMNCMECGCCSFSCIASRRLVDWIRVGKMLAREIK